MSIEDLIDNIATQDFAKAEPIFQDLLASKMNDALEQEKINVASQMFGEEDPEEEQLELDLDDEDIDLDDLEPEEDED